MQVGDIAHIVLSSHPVMIGQTDGSLSSWGNTFHAGLTKMASAFVTVAQGTAPLGDAGTSTTTTIVAAKDAGCVP